MYRYPIAVLFALDLWDLATAQNHCRPKGCWDLIIYKVTDINIESGPHTIYPDVPGLTSLQVSCSGLRTMYQRRLDGTLNEHFR